MISFSFLFDIFSPHPYIVFNQDGESFTFVGFVVTRSGDLLDPSNNRVLKHDIMTPNLYDGLSSNHVNLKDNYKTWTKEIMIEKISTVMGVSPQNCKDPDDSYVLTVDNVTKILAILMRFR